ncbi:MAG: CehA/McbA family metallohydrolase [Minicystis sp.]
MDLRRLLPALSALLVALGIVAGSALDRRPPREASLRGGYRVLEADFHAHTRFADGFLSPFDLVVQADRRGLDVLGVTDHNILFPALMSRWFARTVGGPTILPGEEVTTRRYHLHGVGLRERLDASAPLPEVLAAIHRQGGIAIAAHPVRQYWPAFQAEIDHIDAAEVMHPLAYGGSRNDWSWQQMRQFYETVRGEGHKLTAIGSSDYHFFSPLGVCRTLVFAKDDSEASVIEALKAGRTVVFDLEGRAYGDAEMIDTLAREPYTPRAQDYGYRGSGWADRLARAFGWLGLLGLILVGRRRAAPA